MTQTSQPTRTSQFFKLAHKSITHALTPRDTQPLLTPRDTQPLRNLNVAPR